MTATMQVLETFRADDPRFGEKEWRFVRVRCLVSGDDWRDYTRFVYREPWNNSLVTSDVRHPSLSVAEHFETWGFRPDALIERLTAILSANMIQFSTEWHVLIAGRGQRAESHNWSLNNAMESAIDNLLDRLKVEPHEQIPPPS